MIITYTETLQAPSLNLLAPPYEHDAYETRIAAIDNQSWRINLLKKSKRALKRQRLNTIEDGVLEEVKTGFRWGQHQASMPFFRRPVMGIKKIQAKPDALFTLMDTTLEVFYMIAAELPPRDLLAFSRTCKSIRGTLMSKKARPAWRQVIERADIPPCPADMTEPEYMTLLFDEQCMACHAVYPLVDYRQIFLRVRLCEYCAKRNILPANEVKDVLKDLYICSPDDAEVVASIVPSYEHNDWHVQQELVGDDTYEPNATPDEQALILLSDINAVVDTYDAVKRAGEEPLEEFVEVRREIRERRNRGGHLLAQTARRILVNLLDLKRLVVAAPGQSVDERPRGPFERHRRHAAQLPFYYSDSSATP